MSNKATSAKSIKFYCLVPKIAQGQLHGTEIKATFHQPAPNEELTYSIDTGASGHLMVTIGSTTYVYKLSDIIGRIEIAG